MEYLRPLIHVTHTHTHHAQHTNKIKQTNAVKFKIVKTKCQHIHTESTRITVTAGSWWEFRCECTATTLQQSQPQHHGHWHLESHLQWVQLQPSQPCLPHHIPFRFENTPESPMSKNCTGHTNKVFFLLLLRTVCLSPRLNMKCLKWWWRQSDGILLKIITVFMFGYLREEVLHSSAGEPVWLCGWFLTIISSTVQRNDPFPIKIMYFPHLHNFQHYFKQQNCLWRV